MLCVGVVFFFFFIAVAYSLCDHISKIVFLNLTLQLSNYLVEKYRQSSPRDLIAVVDTILLF